MKPLSVNSEISGTEMKLERERERKKKKIESNREYVGGLQFWSVCLPVSRNSMESHYIEQTSGGWECFGRAEVATSIDCSGAILIMLIFCPVFEAVLHHSEARTRCASMFLVPFTAPLRVPEEQIGLLFFQMSKNLCFQTIEDLKKDKTRWIWSRNAMAIMSERRTRREFIRGCSGAGTGLCPVCRDFLDYVLGMPFETLESPDFSFYPS